MNYKTILLSLLVFIFVSGCGVGSREIDQRTMVLGMGIDIIDDQYVVSVQVPVITPSEGAAATGTEFETITGKGDSVWEAISNIEAYTPTVLFFGHLKAVVIGERLATNDLGKVLDLLDRRAPLANQVYLLIVRKKNSVEEFLSQDSSLVSLPSLYIDRFFGADQKLSRTREVRLFQFRRDISMVSQAGVIPFSYTEPDKDIVIEDLAVFQKGKLVCELLGKEAGVSLLLKNNKVNNINYTTEVEGTTISARISSEVDFQFHKTYPAEITLDIKGEGELVYVSDEEFRTSKENLDKITNTLEEDLKKEVEQTLQKVQEVNVDPWLIGHRLWVKDYDYFRSLDWEETGFKEAIFNINVEVEIVQTGQHGTLQKRKAGR